MFLSYGKTLSILWYKKKDIIRDMPRYDKYLFLKFVTEKQRLDLTKCIHNVFCFRLENIVIPNRFWYCENISCLQQSVWWLFRYTDSSFGNLTHPEIQTLDWQYINANCQDFLGFMVQTTHRNRYLILVSIGETWIMSEVSKHAVWSVSGHSNSCVIHQKNGVIDTPSTLLILCEGIPPVSSGFPSQRGQYCGDLTFSLLSVWISCGTNCRVAGNLRRHDAHVTPL